jgi:katanin p60 ATPase-containing subunit A1
VFWYRHLNTVEDPLIRTKWLKCKRELAEEVEAVKQLDGERQAFKASSLAHHHSSSKSSVFSSADEYPSAGGTSDDGDVWRSPGRDPQQFYGSRRPTKVSQMNLGRRGQDADNKGTSSRKGVTGGPGRGPKSTTAATRPGTRSVNNASQGGKKPPGKTPNKKENLVRFQLYYICQHRL